ncbi:hypothetical protein M9Y10_023527 [Tritrichomonas musculus]|uniref:Glycosyl hydrolase family 98 putative carbohydrate-binding module domain-containing protein n=1 Tax=Tritrichomonas musculus TaxID=1915356 RepID=A0ABR2KYI8_9EUKA
MFYLFISFILSGTPVVSDNDILMTKQTYGGCHRDLSVDGNPLKINGVTYSSGIGTHATSMIPITIPNKAKSLKGLCGVDDEVSGSSGSRSSVIFRILTGSEVLWSSDIMHDGESAVFFEVSIPEGSNKLYLLTDEYDTNANDHADWVNLEWNYYSPSELYSSRVLPERQQKQPTQTLTPNTFEDQGPKLRRMISIARSNPGSTIFLEKGEYHFYSSGSLKMSFHTSNHDQPTFQPIAIPLVDLTNITLDCNGSTFYFHNLLEPILILDSTNVTIKNLHIDYWRPLFNEGTIVSADYFSTTIQINKTLYPYRVENSKLIFENEGFETSLIFFIIFDKDTKRILNGTADVYFKGSVTENSDGTITLTQNIRDLGAKPGDALCLRSYDKPYPGIVVYRATNTTLNNVQVHSAEGMALLAQRSENIHLINSGVTYAEGRYTTTSADSSHFSNCKGDIVVENCIFEGMMDDSINVHSTSLRITEIVNNSCIKLQYVHGQSVGFETFLPGEQVQFIRSTTLENDEIRKVTNVIKITTTELYLSIEGKIPSTIKVGDSVENGNYYARVIFRNNTIRNNRARGCLFTTPKDVLVENNFFDYVAGSAILLAGDAANWYESGSNRNVIIRNNRFLNVLTSTYQFTNAIFSFYPTIGDIKKQTKFYHSNVKIEGNQIDTFDVPLLFGISSENVEFINNKINYNSDFPAWKEKLFQFNKVKNITIEGNIVTPPRTFTIDDVSLENTDDSEIHIK